MLIEQTFNVQAPIQRLWDFLIDVERIGPCVPGVKKVEAIDARTYHGSLEVKVGPIAARFGGKVTLIEIVPPHRLVAKAEGLDSRSSSLVSVTFTSVLTALDDARTQVSYQMDVAVRGPLGQFGQGVMREIVKSTTLQFATCVEARLRDDVVLSK